MLEPSKCVICSYRKYSIEVKSIPYPLCSYCDRIDEDNMLWALLREAEEDFTKCNVIDCEGNLLFSFIADIGSLGIAHPFLARFKDVMAMMARQIAMKGKIVFRELIQPLGSGSLERRVFSLRDFMEMLADVGLIKFEERPLGGRRPIVESNSLLAKVSSTVEQDSLLQRASTFAFGYAILRGIEVTINSVKKKGYLDINHREGIARLYPVTKNGKLMVLKEFTAPAIFLVNEWKRGRNEFSEHDLTRFLANRGITGRKFIRIRERLTSVLPGSVQKLVKHEIVPGSVPYYRFKYNPEYNRLRERLRERARQRER